MTLDELETAIVALGGVRSAARAAADCSRSYLQGVRAGKRPISQKMTDNLRRVSTVVE